MSKLLWVGFRKACEGEFIVHGGTHHHHALDFITGYLLVTITKDFGDGRYFSDTLSYVLRVWTHDGDVYERRFSLVDTLPERHPDVLEQVNYVLEQLGDEICLESLKIAKTVLLT